MNTRLKNTAGGFVTPEEVHKLKCEFIIGPDPDPECLLYNPTAVQFTDFGEALAHFKELKIDYPKTCMILLEGDVELDIFDHWEVDHDHLAVISREKNPDYLRLTYAALIKGGLTNEDALSLSGYLAQTT